MVKDVWQACLLAFLAIGQIGLCYYFFTTIGWTALPLLGPALVLVVLSGASVNKLTDQLEGERRKRFRAYQNTYKVTPAVLRVNITEGNRIFIDDIQERHLIENLEILGNALVANPELAGSFSKAAINAQCRIGGRRYDAIMRELKRLNYAFVTSNNRTVLTPRCKALLRKSATLPY